MTYGSVDIDNELLPGCECGLSGGSTDDCHLRSGERGKRGKDDEELHGVESKGE